MSIVARHDIIVHQGMIVAEPFAPSFYDAATNTLRPVDYTGYRATFTLYASPATLDSLHDTPPLLRLTHTSGAIELGLFDGGEFGDYGILLYLTQAQTSLLKPWGEGIYNLDIMDDFGRPVLRIRGVIELEEGTKHV